MRLTAGELRSPGFDLKALLGRSKAVCEALDDNCDYCILCGNEFIIGEDGNELGFCQHCQEQPDFPYDLERYYKDYDNDKVVFKGFETMSRGLLEKYRK